MAISTAITVKLIGAHPLSQACQLPGHLAQDERVVSGVSERPQHPAFQGPASLRMDGGRLPGCWLNQVPVQVETCRQKVML